MKKQKASSMITDRPLATYVDILMLAGCTGAMVGGAAAREPQLQETLPEEVRQVPQADPEKARVEDTITVSAGVFATAPLVASSPNCGSMKKKSAPMAPRLLKN